MLRLLVPVLALFTLAAQSLPDAAAQNAFIARLREHASRYARELPDFICTQITTRQRGKPGTGQWKQLDILEEQLSFFNRRESYKIIAINGRKPGRKTHEDLDNLQSSGEFGSALDRLFRPTTRAEFRWERRDTLAGRAVVVISYTVSKLYSTMNVVENHERAIMGYHGFLWVDPDTADVLRVSAEAEPQQGFPVKHAGTENDYDAVEISGQRYLLPIRSLSYIETKVIDRNLIEYKDYRKFDTSTSVTYDPGSATRIGK